MVSKSQISDAQNFLNKEKRKFQKTLRANIRSRNAAFNRVRKRRADLIRLRRK